jgi:hypothetical protein
MTPPHKPNGSKRGLIAFSAVAGLAAVIAATAAITYSVTRQPVASTGSTATSVAATAAAGPEQQAAAKKRVCELFDAGTKGQAGKGGVRVEDQLNIPVVLRMMNSASAVQSALTPEVPSDVDQAAREYIARTFDLTTEATGEGNIETLSRLNDEAIKAIDSLVGACGLPR